MSLKDCVKDMYQVFRKILGVRFQKPFTDRRERAVSTQILSRVRNKGRLIKPLPGPIVDQAKVIQGPEGEAEPEVLIVPSKWFDHATRLLSLLKEHRVKVKRLVKGPGLGPTDEKIEKAEIDKFTGEIVAKLEPALATGLRDSVLAVFRDLERLERDCEYVAIATLKGNDRQAEFVRACLHRSGLLTAARNV